MKAFLIMTLLLFLNLLRRSYFRYARFAVPTTVGVVICLMVGVFTTLNSAVPAPIQSCSHCLWDSDSRLHSVSLDGFVKLCFSIIKDLMMIDPELESYARKLGPQREDVKRLLKAAARSEDGTRIAKSVFRAKLRRAGRDPDDNNPFSSIIPPEVLGGSGVSLGQLADGSGEMIWRHGELPLSALLLGPPGFGKTTAAIHLLDQLTRFYPIIICDLRGDYECLCRTLPNVRFFWSGSFPINLLRGPDRVPPDIFYQRFAETFTDEFGLFQASRRYLNLVLDSLEARRVETGH